MRVGTSELARLLGISRQRINALARKGKIKRGADRKWDPDKVREALGRNLDIHQGAPSLGQAREERKAPAPRARKSRRQSPKVQEPEDDSDESQISLADAQLKHELAKASKTEFEVARLRGILIDAEEAVLEWQRQIMAARKHALQVVPGRLAPKVAAEGDILICQHLIEREMRAMLRELSKYQPDA